jgi:hypothetical protein
VIGHHPVSIHPGVNVAGDLQRQRFLEGEVDGTAGLVVGLNNEVLAVIGDRIRVDVVSGPVRAAPRERWLREG